MSLHVSVQAFCWWGKTRNFLNCSLKGTQVLIFHRMDDFSAFSWLTGSFSKEKWLKEPFKLLHSLAQANKLFSRYKNSLNRKKKSLQCNAVNSVYNKNVHPLFSRNMSRKIKPNMKKLIIIPMWTNEVNKIETFPTRIIYVFLE